VKENKQKWAIQ